VLNTVNKLALNDGVSIFHLIMYRYVVVVIICAAWLAGPPLIRGRSMRDAVVPTKRLAFASASCAVLMLASLFFTLTALSMGEVSVVVPIASLSFIFTALLSFIFLRERLSVLKVVGIVLAAASITIIG
jgi:uncharacterized membrane protein